MSQKVYELASEDDYTQPELCKILGISVSTFHEWKNSKPEFLEALKRAEETRNERFKEIARISLRKKLEGFEHEEVTQEGVTDKEGNYIPKSIKKVRKYFPPDTTTIIFTLKILILNRFPTPTGRRLQVETVNR